VDGLFSLAPRFGNPPARALPGCVKFYCFYCSPVADLTLTRQFSLESHSRAIDSCNDVAELRRVAKTLLSAWHLQADMTRHYGAQAMGIASAAL
jgi:hypothetical protein